jgi:hypothetical protein
VMTFLVPKNFPQRGGATVTISGTNFGPPPLPNFVTISGTPVDLSAQVLLLGNSSQLGGATVMTFPPYVDTTMPGTNFVPPPLPAVDLSGQVLLLGNFPQLGGATVTISGTNFGPVDLSANAHVGISPCGTASWTTGTSLRCLTPQGSGVAMAINVVVSELSGTHEGFFPFDFTQPPSFSPSSSPSPSPATCCDTVARRGCGCATRCIVLYRSRT